MGKVKNTKIYQILESAADKLGGKLTYSYQQLNGGMMTGGLYNFVIATNWNGLSLQITSSLDELPLQKDEYDSCQIKITAYKKSPNETNLSIWRRDYFDRIFGFGILKTGFKDFDKIIALKSSKNIEKYIRKVFENQSLRTELINDVYRTINIHSDKGKIIIQRKSALRMKNKEMIIDDYNRFGLFLTGLKDANII